MNGKYFTPVPCNLTFDQIDGLDLITAVKGQGRSTLIRSIVQSFLDAHLAPEVDAEAEVAK